VPVGTALGVRSLRASMLVRALLIDGAARKQRADPK
jgi:hypothetical protein